MRGLDEGQTPVASLPPTIVVPASSDAPPVTMTPEPLPEVAQRPADLPERHPLSKAPWRPALEELLRTKSGNINAIGRVLGGDRKQVYRWLPAAGISRDEIASFRS
ncbi:MAG: hypothetical protein KC502_11260 [Myxococcales bacterium]|nr:hypothetical protein [Myxococcales bacterium]